MMRYLLYIVVGLLYVSPTEATEVIFEGQVPVNRRNVERLARKPGVEADTIQALMVNEGYLDAVVRFDTSIAYVTAGERYMIEAINWLSDSSAQSSIGRPFTRGNTEVLIDEKLRDYRELGHFYSTASITDISRQGNSVSLDIRLNPGPVLAYGNNIFSGLKRTRPELVEKYVGFGDGQVLTEDDLAYAERRAAAITFVDFQPPAKIRPQPGFTGADIEFVFKEKKQVLFSGGGGIVPGTSSSLVWNLDLKFQNLFGSGRMVRFVSEKREKDRQILEIGYRQPVLLLGLGEVGLDVATRDYRDQFYEFSVRGDFRTNLTPTFSFGLELGWRSVEPSDLVPSYTSLHSAFSIERSVMNDRMNPLYGLSMAWTISFGYRRYSDDSLAAGSERASFNETRSTVRVRWYQRVKGALIAHVGLNYVGLETGETLPPVSELYYVGGPGTLRGYRNEQFSALRTAFGTVEPRIRFEGGYLICFFDAAYINNRVADTSGGVVSDEIYRYSYGVGTAIIDGARSVKISVGWNPDAPFDQPRLSLEFSADI